MQSLYTYVYSIVLKIATQIHYNEAVTLFVNSRLGENGKVDLPTLLFLANDRKYTLCFLNLEVINILVLENVKFPMQC